MTREGLRRAFPEGTPLPSCTTCKVDYLGDGTCGACNLTRAFIALDDAAMAEIDRLRQFAPKIAKSTATFDELWVECAAAEGQRDALAKALRYASGILKAVAITTSSVLPNASSASREAAGIADAALEGKA
jgi:hypothetical protein